MKHFMILHYGFKQPSTDEMTAWNEWFQFVEDIKVENGGFKAGREIKDAEVNDLPFGEHSITGYTIIEAPDLDAATEIAVKCPRVDSTRVYEIRKG